MKYNFSNAHYERTHGKAPRGRGWWMFEDGNRNIVADVPCLHTLAEAKKIAAEQLKEKGFPVGMTVYIAP